MNHDSAETLTPARLALYAHLQDVREGLDQIVPGQTLTSTTEAREVRALGAICEALQLVLVDLQTLEGAIDRASREENHG